MRVEFELKESRKNGKKGIKGKEEREKQTWGNLSCQEMFIFRIVLNPMYPIDLLHLFSSLKFTRYRNKQNIYINVKLEESLFP